MARPKRQQSVGLEEELAVRIESEMTARGWSYRRFSEAMTAAGCPIDQSNIQRIVNPAAGRPRRRITLDEAAAFVAVLGITDLDLRSEDALKDALSREAGHQALERAMEIAARIYDDWQAYDHAIGQARKAVKESPSFKELLEEENSEVMDEWVERWRADWENRSESDKRTLVTFALDQRWSPRLRAYDDAAHDHQLAWELKTRRHS